MNASQWFWCAGATLAFMDVGTAVRFEANPDPQVFAFAVGLMTVGLTIGFINGVWGAWENWNAEQRGEPA